MSIHTDRRHAPIAATNAQGQVIWQTQYDAWGKVSTPSPFKGEGWGAGKISPINNTVHEPAQAQQQNNHFNLSLRLPGQWQDQATNHHYNYQRDYNPDAINPQTGERQGQYLTPDPLGFADGPDPYAYVGNDPLNKIDPLGLYQSDIHYYMTFFLGVVAGVPVDDARTIALAAQYLDDNPLTQPLPHNLGVALWNIKVHNPAVITRLLSYHFTATPSIIGMDGLAHPTTVQEYVPDGLGGHYVTKIATAPASPEYTHIAENTQLGRLAAAYQKPVCNSKTQFQFFGEYLHAFQDTFGHRDYQDVPIDAEGGFGHGKYLSHPDYTYNHYGPGAPTLTESALSNSHDYNTNQARTLQMEREVFNKFKNFGGDLSKNILTRETNKIPQEFLDEVLMRFNAIQENDDNTDHFAPGNSVKINYLQAMLEIFGFKVNLTDNVTLAGKASFMGYYQSEGAKRRNLNLCPNGKPLKQTDYPGTILPAWCQAAKI